MPCATLTVTDQVEEKKINWIPVAGVAVAVAAVGSAAYLAARKK